MALGNFIRKLFSKNFTVTGASKPTPVGSPRPSKTPKWLDELGATIYAEAGNDPQEMRAIASVVVNRAKEREVDIMKVLNAPNQFQGRKNPQFRLYFNKKKDYPSQLKYDEVQKIMGELAAGVFKPSVQANFFAQDPTPPKFIRNGKTVGQYGSHYFYQGHPDYIIGK